MKRIGKFIPEPEKEDPNIKQAEETGSDFASGFLFGANIAGFDEIYQDKTFDRIETGNP